MKTKESRKVYFYFTVILLLNSVYFFIYFLYLDAGISLLNLFFITVGTISYLLLLQILRWRTWEVLSYFIVALYFLFCLINFAYFKVFASFSEFSFGQMKTMTGSFATFLSDYFYLIPLEIYLLTILVFLITIIIKTLYFRSRRPIKFIFQNSTAQLKSNRRYAIIALLILIFGFLNLIAIGTAQYLASHPKNHWWDETQHLLDLGIFGSFYTNLITNKNQNNFNSKPIAQTPETNQAFSNIFTTDFFHLTPIEKTNQLLSTLASKQEQPTTINLPVINNSPNFLIIQLESIAQWPIEHNPSAMPFLKGLMENNITIENFHANSCETINAELAINCSTFANSYEPVPYSHLENDYYCLPQILKDKLNYNTYFFHANTMDFWRRDILVPKWGFEKNYFVPHFRQKAYDQYIFDESIDILTKEDKPFYAYITTFTSHAPHNQELVDYHRDKNQLEITPYIPPLNETIKNIEIPEEQTRLYLGFLQATDDALKFLMEKLERTNLLQNTVVIIVNDHRFYNFNSDTLQDFNNYNQTPFVMILPDKQQGQIQRVASHLDIAPTILNIAEPQTYQKPQHFLGASLFENNFPNQALNKCLGKIYYINENYIFQGNAKTSQYNLFHSTKSLDPSDNTEWQNMISQIVKYSDEAIYSNQLIN